MPGTDKMGAYLSALPDGAFGVPHSDRIPWVGVQNLRLPERVMITSVQSPPDSMICAAQMGRHVCLITKDVVAKLTTVQCSTKDLLNTMQSSPSEGCSTLAADSEKRERWGSGTAVKTPASHVENKDSWIFGATWAVRWALKHGYRMLRRLVIAVVGFSVLFVGLLMVIGPGPAVIVIPLGLAILAIEFRWARRLLQYVRQHLQSGMQEFARRTGLNNKASKTGAADAAITPAEKFAGGDEEGRSSP